MASVRNLPYGFSANYETVIKIIGSKYVRCLVEKSDGKAKETIKPATQSVLRTLPKYPTDIRHTHGNSPADLNKSPGQQITCGVNVQEKSAMREHTSKQTEMDIIRSVDKRELKPTNTYCVTAPGGDKSMSYIHSIQKSSIEAQNLKQCQEQEDVLQLLAETKAKDDPLLTLLRKEHEMHPVSLAALSNLREELKLLDPRKSGFLPQAQLSNVLLKNEVPLQLPTVKLLFKRFSQANDQELINYERLIQLLTQVASSKMQHSFPEKSQIINNQTKSSWTPEELLRALKQILKEQKGELDLEKLSLSFLQEDKICSGLLSFSEVEKVCQKHRLFLYPGMMETLVNLYGFDRRGRIKWQSFVEFLKEIQIGTNPASLICQRRNMEENEDDSMIKQQHKLLASKSWDSDDSDGRETWIDRFRKLEKALYLSDVKNTGKLEKEKAKRLIHNYNQIYDLCLSPLKIDKAFRPFHPGQDMPLEPLLDYLKEL